MSSIKIKQHDITDCGAACLASISAHYKLKLPIAKIRQMASTDKKGTNILGMIEAANKLGFDAKGVRANGIENLYDVPHPTVAHVIVNEVLHHFVVIYEANEKHIKVMDPGDGQIHKYSHEEFDELWTKVLILISPNDEFETGNHQVSMIKRFWFLVKPHRSVMTQALVGALIYTVLGLSTSIYVQKIIDYVLVGGNKNLLNIMSVGMIAILLFRVFLGSAQSYFTIKTGQQIDARLILGYYKHLLKLPQRFFDTMRTGEIISRINDAIKIRTFINDVSINLIVNVLIVAFSFTLMFIYSWKLALIMMAILPIYAGIYALTNKLNKKTQRGIMENAAELESQLVESINSVGTIKRFGLEEFANLKTESRFVKLLQSVFKSTKTTIFSSNSSEFIATLFTIILLWTGATFVLDGDITAGELLSFYALIGYLTGPVNSLIGMNKSIQDANIAAERLFELMDLEREEMGEKFDLKPEMIGDISLKNIKFRYGSRANVFDDFSLNIKKGQMTALVGESGSGKSTLIHLLQNIYPIESGNISIGDHNLKYVSNESLRKLVAVVPQNIDLFSGNVIENIAVGEFNPDVQRIIDICKTIGIMEFIETLPDGFNTHLGENGASLSGGQKQRIAIARALYKQPEVLILDEATSSLDSASEVYVQNAINKLKKENKTIIVIAHRLATIHNADKICVLEKGQLLEEGSHDDLMLSNGKYCELWKQQFPMMENMMSMN
ncbi:peptidase domain-containing ABC transporter [Aureibacter tunicatorum]|uniref:ATP-binding cassette subfamily B protein n=1 Tax=Aureibacter tunicatorum TaxID=866807 RepID=A0AAE3XUQ0_9BACT|nr:peptidase domain-containing ABC transporter [Aureibacter tunicatorum]MDR6242074.1 ATP-binding cassette subfamily B protein [Aureibacter tunicatorum]BDD07556.1 bacteriocin cleavage/export ABC transporter [Aureibacter tunicatorum]